MIRVTIEVEDERIAGSAAFTVVREEAWLGRGRSVDQPEGSLDLLVQSATTQAKKLMEGMR